MRDFTDARTPDQEDELWVCEHQPVYTLGQAGRSEHIHNAANIPVVHSDRGGQVTYHGPGQVIAYALVNLRRAGFSVRSMVTKLENSVVNLLHQHGIQANSRPDAPGVYVNEAKIAALGLRVRKGCTYHGVAMNIDTDLSPFAGIDPCGFQGMRVTSTTEQGIEIPTEQLVGQFVQSIHQQLESG